MHRPTILTKRNTFINEYRTDRSTKSSQQHVPRRITNQTTDGPTDRPTDQLSDNDDRTTLFLTDDTTHRPTVLTKRNTFTDEYSTDGSMTQANSLFTDG